MTACSGTSRTSASARTSRRDRSNDIGLNKGRLRGNLSQAFGLLPQVCGGEFARVATVHPLESSLMVPKATARTVFVPKPLDLTYGDAMSCLRGWLDDRRMQACGFKITAEGRIGFEISFSQELDATRFETFTWPRLTWQW
jgi:hypothetical protein